MKGPLDRDSLDPPEAARSTGAVGGTVGGILGKKSSGTKQDGSQGGKPAALQGPGPRWGGRCPRSVLLGPALLTSAAGKLHVIPARLWGGPGDAGPGLVWFCPPAPGGVAGWSAGPSRGAGKSSRPPGSMGRPFLQDLGHAGTIVIFFVRNRMESFLQSAGETSGSC